MLEKLSLVKYPIYVVVVQLTSGKYINKGVKELDLTHVGHLVRETEGKVIVFGHYEYRFDFSSITYTYATLSSASASPLFRVCYQSSLLFMVWK